MSISRQAKEIVKLTQLCVRVALHCSGEGGLGAWSLAREVCISILPPPMSASKLTGLEGGSKLWCNHQLQARKDRSAILVR